MTADIVIRQVGMPSTQELQNLRWMSEMLASSSVFKGVNGPAQAFAKIMLGRGLGLGPAEALTSIDIVDGKPELSANLQAAMMRAYVGPDGERYDYEVEKLDGDGCVLNFTRSLMDGKIELLGTSSFTTEDAVTAGLTDKPNYKAYARNMYFARAVSNGIAWYCPEVTYGVRTYTHGEIDPDRFTPIPDAPEAVQMEAPGASSLPSIEGSATEALPPAAAAPEIEHAGRNDMLALRAAIDEAQIAGDALASLFDGVGIPAGDTARDRVKLASREQVLAATERAKATAPTAPESVQQTIDGTATETSSAPVEGVMGAEAA